MCLQRVVRYPNVQIEEVTNSHLTGTCVNCGLLQSAEWLTKRENCGGQVETVWFARRISKQMTTKR